jgi:hypothetical protein
LLQARINEARAMLAQLEHFDILRLSLNQPQVNGAIAALNTLYCDVVIRENDNLVFNDISSNCQTCSVRHCWDDSIC